MQGRATVSVGVSQDLRLCCGQAGNGGLCSFGYGLHKQLMVPSLHTAGGLSNRSLLC